MFAKFKKRKKRKISKKNMLTFSKVLQKTRGDYIKKSFCLIVFVISAILSTTIFAENKEAENYVQLSDYKDTECRHLFDGYTYCRIGEKADIINPNGTPIYNSGQYYVPYSMGMTDWETHNQEQPIRFPQSEQGNTFIVSTSPYYDNERVIKANGDILTPVDQTRLDPMGKNFFGSEIKYGADAYNKEKRIFGTYGVISSATGELLAAVTGERYLCENQENFLTIEYYSMNDTDYADINFYNKDGKIFDIARKIEWDEHVSNEYYDRRSSCIIDKYGRKYLEFRNGDYGHYAYMLQNLHTYEAATYDYVLADAHTEETASERADHNYVFKEKEIGGKTYYAIFKKLTNKESAKDYIIHTENIPKSTYSAYEKGLIYNNSMSHFDEYISKQDLCILLVNAYCKSKGMEIDEYINSKDITLDFERFEDTDDVYILLAEKLGIFTDNDKWFEPYSSLTSAEGAVYLNNFAKLMKVKPGLMGNKYTDIDSCSAAEIKAIKALSKTEYSDGNSIISIFGDEAFIPNREFIRADAYSGIYKIYDLSTQSSLYANIKKAILILTLTLAGVYMFAKFKIRKKIS